MKKLLPLLCLISIMVFSVSSCSKPSYDHFATLYGVVSDHTTGEPLAGASVVLSPGGKTKTTGTDGRFEFADLDPQQYTITVQKTGYQTNRKTVTAVVAEKTEANIPLTTIH
jgi:carbon monoxide dehydrogenase subunit G